MMTANKIANSDLLDILFDGRNKAYGAYPLRREYNKRMTIAMAIVLSASLVIFLSSLASRPQQKINLIIDTRPVELVDVKDDPIPEIPATPPPELAQLHTEDFVIPQIVPDELVDPADIPPTQDVMETAVISNYQQDGVDVEDMVAPGAPVEKTGTGLAIQPDQSPVDYEKTFVKVEQEAEFPGGREAWRRFLERYVEYPQDAIDNGKEATVRVEFVVDKEGNISELKTLDDPGYGLAEEALRVMKKSPKWVPAEQNGRKVKYRHIQGIVFHLQ